MDYPQEVRAWPTVMTDWSLSFPGSYPAVAPLVGQFPLVDGISVTQSYRSKGGKNAQDPVDGFVQTSGSQAGFYRELRAEYQRTSRPYDTGHEFWTETSRVEWPRPVDCVAFSGISDFPVFRYNGMLLPVYHGVTHPNVDAPTSTQINVDGARLIGMTIPTRPEAGMVQFLAELRQDLPSVPGTAILTSLRSLLSIPGKKVIGEEVLNWEFGVRPLINDLQKMARAVLDMQKIVSKYAARSGKPTRRHATLEDSSRLERRSDLDSYVMFHGMDPYWTNVFFRNNPVSEVYDEHYTAVKFSGAYTYLLAEGHRFLDKMERYGQQADHLLGLRLSASTVWELAPWSWLIDWFSDVGLFINNVQSLSDDSLVLRYGYVMHENRAVRTYIKHGILPAKDSGAVPSSIRVDATICRKTRYRATPYGFGVDLSALTPERDAILAALGMTKSRGNLR